MQYLSVYPTWWLFGMDSPLRLGRGDLYRHYGCVPYIYRKPSHISAGGVFILCVLEILFLYHISDFSYEFPYWLKQRLHFLGVCLIDAVIIAFLPHHLEV